jgi:hypothetical protein
MRLSNVARGLAPVLATVTVAFVVQAPARAWIGYQSCHCHPSCAVFHSEFYGYYRTCWRLWPPQPPCPPALHAMTRSPAVGEIVEEGEPLPPPRKEPVKNSNAPKSERPSKK